MGRPTAEELLRAWERGQSAGPVARGLLLLATAHPRQDPAELAAISVGQRDRLLLDLREELFGSSVEAVVRCSACRADLEVECTIADLRCAEECASPFTVRCGDAELIVRLPDSVDLAHAAAAGSIAAGRRVLFDRCVDAPPSDPSDELLTSVAAALAEADPQAAMALEVTCPECGADAAVPYDVVSFLWRELDGWAARTLSEIHALASAYGWTEDTILALSAARRRAYLDLVSG